MAESTPLPTPVTPILIQQPANPYDAKKAVERGIDDIVVSNYAGDRLIGRLLVRRAREDR